jgi:hypothetical protein
MKRRPAPFMKLNPSAISRRHFLRATGITLALPVLEHFLPRGYAAASTSRVRRMVTMNSTLGLWPDHLFPQTAGLEYEATPYLDVFKDFRREFTVFSGVSHPGVRAGHEAQPCFLSAAPMDRGGSFHNSISLDQYAAEKFGAATRFSSLILTTGADGGGSSSVNRGGVLLPPSNSPSAVFQKLFLAGSPGEIYAQVARIEEGRSIMDVVLDQSKRLDARLGAEDRARLDQYFTSVRELEQRMVENQAWARKPKPKVEAKIPADIPDKADFVARARLMYDLTRLALQTDSTRVVAIQNVGANLPPIAGVTTEWHGLTHNGKDPEKLAELKLIELAMLDLVREFLAKLKDTPDQDGTLFDHTNLLFGSHLGHAGRHDCTNLPMILFGGGFKHGGHLAFDREHNTPAARIYVAMLQRLGIETDEFASGKGRIPGLELA